MSLFKGMTFVSLFFLLISSSFAQSRRDLKRDIQDLSYRIERDVEDTDASNNRLRQARSYLEDALDLIRDRGDDPRDPDLFQKCLDYSYDKFRRSYNDSTSLDKARVICRNVVDLGILKFLYERHFRSLSPGQAMQKAGEQAVSGTRGKLDLLDFAYDRHFRSLSPSNAATKSVENIKLINLRRNTNPLSCFKKYYDIYLRSMSPSRAMDKTADTCSEI